MIICKDLFPNKVPSTGTGLWTWTTLGGDPVQLKAGPLFSSLPTAVQITSSAGRLREPCSASHLLRSLRLLWVTGWVPQEADSEGGDHAGARLGGGPQNVTCGGGSRQQDLAGSVIKLPSILKDGLKQPQWELWRWMTPQSCPAVGQSPDAGSPGKGCDFGQGPLQQAPSSLRG